MNRGLVLIPLAVLAAASLASCSGDDVTIEAGGGSAAETTGVTVTGHGEVQVKPDTGFFEVGVQVTAPTVEAARDRAAQAAEAVIASLKKNGVEDKDIQTINLNIAPQYDYSKNTSTPTIVGYIVTNTVTVKVRKLDTFSKLVDDSVSAGGNDARLQGIRFGVEDNAKALEQAREAAMKDAKAKADQLAKLGGVSLGKPRSIAETQSTNPPVKYATDAAARDGAFATPIETGTSGITVDVTVRWAFD